MLLDERRKLIENEDFWHGIYNDELLEWMFEKRQRRLRNQNLLTTETKGEILRQPNQPILGRYYMKHLHKSESSPFLSKDHKQKVITVDTLICLYISLAQWISA